MILKRVEFLHYKSITGDALDIEKDITCIVGINEAGKSNLLLGIEKSDNAKELTHSDITRSISEFHDTTTTPELKLWFEPYDGESKELAEIFGVSVKKIVLYKSGNTYRLDFPAINYKGSKFFSPTPIANPSLEVAPENNGASQTETIVAEPVVTEKTAPDPNVEEQGLIRNKVIEELKLRFIPRFFHFDSVNLDLFYLPQNGEIVISEFIKAPDSNKPIKNLLNLGGISDFNRLVANTEDERIARDMILNEASKKINDEILRVVWPIESVEVSLSSENDLLKLRIKEKDIPGIFKPGERSRGMQWSLAFNIYFLAETKGAITNSILLIDEPGIFLHIDAQKRLLEQTFPEMNKTGNQIIYTTHLPYLIDSRFPERIRILSKNEKNKVQTEIGNKAWSRSEFGKIPEPVKTALGMKWTELFNFSNKNAIVEGPSDQIILRSFLKLFQKEGEIEFLPSYGVKKIPSVLAIAKVEEKKAFGLYDGDQDMVKAREKCAIGSIPGNAIETIPVIVDAPEIITIEDTIPPEIFKEAIFNVYESVCSRIRNCELTLDEIPAEYPRVKTVEEFFKNKFKRTGHKLLKIEVARAISGLVDVLKIKKGDAKWEIARKLVEGIDLGVTSNHLNKAIKEKGSDPGHY